MRKIKLLSGIVIIGAMLTSCYTEVIIEDELINDPVINTAYALESYDLWYVDLNATRGAGEVPFIETAFTLSFNDGVLYANNNLVGIGKTGNGFGVDVGFYNILANAIEIDHDLGGTWILEVFQLNGNTLELYDSSTDTSYYLKGYQRNTFDFDLVFYDNIHYFLQEYQVWEKVFTSAEGSPNEFDNENFLQFLSADNGSYFRSSTDGTGTPINQILWDYEGSYSVFQVQNDETLKTLTLDYDFMGNDYFELYVINDSTIELYHSDSGTVYEFRGRNFKQYLKSDSSQGLKKRSRQKLPTMNVKRKRK